MYFKQAFGFLEEEPREMKKGLLKYISDRTSWITLFIISSCLKIIKANNIRMRHAYRR